MYSILYVDDESALLELGKLFLEQSGQFSVDTIISAPDALSLLNSKTYDAIISDYQMPEMDGIAFLKRVRGSGNNIPFILFTGRGREEIVIQALNEGANFYLQKGGDPIAQFTELIHKIQIAIEHHQAAKKIQSLNRLYSVLSETNRAIFHIRTKAEFFSEICRILVETGGFRMAWIGLANPELASIRPVASAGHVDGYLDTVNISTEDVPRGRGPTGTAYREGKYIFSNDITKDSRMEPWRENALKRGYLANAAFPFAPGTNNAGVLSLYAPSTGFFDEKIIMLLEELADDISFVLRILDDQDAVKRAEDALRESEERYRAVVEDQTEFISRFLPDGTHVFFNEAYCRYFGLNPDELLGHRFLPKIPVEDQERVKRFFESLTIDHPVDVIEHRIIMADGTIRWHQWSDRAIFDTDGHIREYQSVGRDITDKKKSEDDLRAAYEQITADEEELRSQYDELKDREQVIFESEQKLQGIVRGSPIPQFVIDKNQRVISWNRALEEYSGVKASEVLGTTHAWKAFYDTERPVLSNLLVENNPEKIKELYAGKYSTSKYVDGAYEVTDFFPRWGGPWHLALLHSSSPPGFAG